MKLAELTSSNLIMLDTQFNNRIEAIEALTNKLDESGKLSDKKMFLDAVMEREEEGPTALGEHLAVPHGKSEAVKEPVFACAVLKDDLQWKGLDGDEPVNLIFLLAIPPAQAGSTHMAILTTLTSLLVEDEFRAALLNCKSTEQVMALLSTSGDSDEQAEIEEEPVAEQETEKEELVMDEQPEATDFSGKAYPMFLLGGIAVATLMFFLF